jgi:hypothetical protein
MSSVAEGGRLSPGSSYLLLVRAGLFCVCAAARISELCRKKSAAGILSSPPPVFGFNRILLSA